MRCGIKSNGIATVPTTVAAVITTDYRCYFGSGASAAPGTALSLPHHPNRRRRRLLFHKIKSYHISTQLSWLASTALFILQFVAVASVIERAVDKPNTQSRSPEVDSKTSQQRSCAENAEQRDRVTEADLLP